MKRDIKLDLLKTISILGVVYIHSSYLFTNLVKLPTALFRFGVPIFIISTFVLAERSTVNRPFTKDVFLKRLNRLIAPFLFWSVVYFLLAFNGSNITQLLVSNLYGNEWPGQYYFIIVLQLTVLFYLIQHRSLNKLITLSCFVLTAFLYMYTTYFSEFNGTIHSAFFYWLVYLVFAIYWVQEEDKRNLSVSDSLAGIVVSLLFMALEDWFLKKRHIAADPYTRVSVLSSAVAIFICFRRMPNRVFANMRGWLLSQVDLISRHSLGIFCINPLLAMAASYVIPNSIRHSTKFYNIFSPYLLMLLIAYTSIIIAKLFIAIKLDRLVR